MKNKLIRRGRPFGKKFPRRLNHRVDDDVFKAVEGAAKKAKINISEWVRRAISFALKNKVI